EGLAGLIYASGIPGTLAGAIVGNAGAFGSQIGDVVKSVDVLLPSGEERTLRREQLRFGYRHSILKEMTAVVVSATLALQPGDMTLLTQERNDILDSRKTKHPDYQKIPCAGSFFKNIVNPDGTRKAAGWFLDQAGCKTLSVGDAGVFDRHANIIINRGKAKAIEVYQLSEQMKERVRAAFHITLEPEVRFIGNFS
ncbi:MAG TPA: UDP-N-acetylmuramate dehydrogenase, partial [Candidatus Bathyarchaeia archaeon]|nr:UDP-N-acetylmuramate dehydrogenase [Candidatus Bathyarchaeia archaeon]